MREIEGLVRKYVRAGYEYEVFFQRLKKTKVEVSGGEVENLSVSEETGVGIRILREGRIGFSYTTTLTEESIKETVLRATEACDLQVRDPGNRFLEELKISEAVSVFDREGAEAPLEMKIDLVMGLERKAKDMDPRIMGVRKASLTESLVSVEVSNSHGVRFGFDGTFYSSTIATLGVEGTDQTMSWEFRGARRLKDLDTEDMVRSVVFKTVSQLNPRPIKTRVMPVVLFNDVSAMILDAFKDMFLGDSLVKGKTLLKDRVGERVSSEKVTVVDDGTMEGGFNTTPYDAEGVPRRRNIVIERGVFKGFLHSLYTASRSGEDPTGNSGRDSFRSQPVSDTTNLFIEKGDVPLEALLEAEEEVFLVLDLMGLHTVDPVSGEFSLGASGVIYKGGKPDHAVRGVTIAGNILDLWDRIVMVGEDLKFFGGVGSPSLLVRDITVGGS
ncbi:MAG: TldD/PmbA family protein [Aquificota bacterium]|nr:TldD/PmbA family protein [Aquificota bacterium]